MAPSLNRVLERVFSMERALLGRVRLPMGGSILCMACHATRMRCIDVTDISRPRLLIPSVARVEGEEMVVAIVARSGDLVGAESVRFLVSQGFVVVGIETT